MPVPAYRRTERRSGERRGQGITCPSCGATNTWVTDTRTADGGNVRRRRYECAECKTRFTTIEQRAGGPRQVRGANGSRPIRLLQVEDARRSAMRAERRMDEARSLIEKAARILGRRRPERGKDEA